MTPEEEAYEEALRRIREAERTGALELDLSGLNKILEFSELVTLNQLPRELARLTSLQSLDFFECKQAQWRPVPACSTKKGAHGCFLDRP